jgi:hypothetical protein
MVPGANTLYILDTGVYIILFSYTPSTIVLHKLKGYYSTGSASTDADFCIGVHKLTGYYSTGSASTDADFCIGVQCTVSFIVGVQLSAKYSLYNCTLYTTRTLWGTIGLKNCTSTGLVHGICETKYATM